MVDQKHPVDQRLPAGRLIVLGLQHVLVMYAGCVAVPLIVGGALGLDARTVAILVNADLFVAGVITIAQNVGLVQVTRVRSRYVVTAAGVILVLLGLIPKLGMVPVVAPSFYGRLPDEFQIISGSSITTTVVVVFLFNLLFNHLPWRREEAPADAHPG